MRLRVFVLFAVLVPVTGWAQTSPSSTYPIYQPIAPVAPVAPIYVPATRSVYTPPIYTRTAPVVVGSDGTYLGRLSSNRYDADSTSNPYGQYGSPYSPTSVNNRYGKYGSPYSAQSATNPYATQAPEIIAPNGQPLGRLSTNPYAPDSIANPYGAGSRYAPNSVTNPYSPYYNPLLVPPTKKK